MKPRQRKGPSLRAFPMERMKGLEPSTFCKRTRATNGILGAHGNDVLHRDRPRIFPFFSVARYHGVTTEAGLERVPHPRPLRFGVEQVASISDRRCSLTAVAEKFRMKCLMPFIYPSLLLRAFV
jgi:hypothetical protein